MKFTQADSNLIKVSTSIETDGCALLKVDDIDIARLTNEGKLALILLNDSNVRYLKNKGFNIRNGSIEVF